MFTPNEVDTVIVGAGPVGLLNAIGLLRKNPGSKLVLLEKYAEYSRHHVVWMRYGEIDQYIKAIGEPVDPVLKSLYERVKKKGFIRTSEVEKILKAQALALGAEIQIKTVENIQLDIYDAFPNVNLIMGADGTHSVVSKQVFGPDNFIKFPFDYVLQFRYQINGDVSPIELPTLAKFMQSYGLTCDEFVGIKDEQGKTPVTLQLMVTKEQFDKLYPVATSKTPLLPFSEEALNIDKMDPILQKRIKGYLGLRLKHFTPPGQIIDLATAGVSVNEAPATRAIDVYKNVNGKHVVLVGDAALGLSYWKGLNAGVESSAKLLPAISADPTTREEALIAYNDWFDKIYAPKKIKEVGNFSFYAINLLILAFKVFNFILRKEFFMDPDEAERSVDLYQGYLATRAHNHIPVSSVEPIWTPYPHREKAQVDVLQFTMNPIAYLKENWKNIKDTFTHYKSWYHVLRDILSPIRALFQVTMGAIEVILAIPTILFSSLIGLIAPGDRSRWQRVKDAFSLGLSVFAEGCARILLGFNLTLTSILIPFRVIVRVAITIHDRIVSGQIAIEKNIGMQKLIHKIDLSETCSTEKINALCVDIHRKYQKAVDRGQATAIDVADEEALFKRCNPCDRTSYQTFFSLFDSSVTKEREEQCLQSEWKSTTCVRGSTNSFDRNFL